MTQSPDDPMARWPDDPITRSFSVADGVRPLAAGHSPGTIGAVLIGLLPPEVKQGAGATTADDAPPAVDHPSLRHLPLEARLRSKSVTSSNRLGKAGDG
jgi:hypothetical protein